MIKEQVKPNDIDISRGLGGSLLQKSEKETIACNIIVIGRKSGDNWPEFSWEQYVNLCEHEVTGAEHAVLDQLVKEDLLSCEGSVYRIRDKFIAILWDFVADALKS